MCGFIKYMKAKRSVICHPLIELCDEFYHIKSTFQSDTYCNPSSQIQLGHNLLPLICPRQLTLFHHPNLGKEMA